MMLETLEARQKEKIDKETDNQIKLIIENLFFAAYICNCLSCSSAFILRGFSPFLYYYYWLFKIPRERLIYLTE
jgi:hypothetical protein